MAPSGTLPHPVPDALAELIAQRFRVLADPTRIKILDALRDGPASVPDLQARTGTSQQNVSKHLAVLVDSAMVGRTREGSRSYYAVTDQTLFRLCEQVCGGLRRRVAQLEAILQSEVPA